MDIENGLLGVEAGAAGGASLTPQTLFKLDYIAPPTALSDYITTLYHFRCDEAVIRDIQPAAIGQLAIFPYGQGEMQFRDGRSDPSHETNLLTPFSVAAPFFVNGPFHAIGAVMSTLGWAALTGLDASRHGNRLVRAGDWLGQEVEQLGARLCVAYRAGDMTGHDCVMALCDHIGRNLKPVNPRHAELIRQAGKWLGSSLNPRLSDLMEQAAYSERQVQRLVERYFGLAPQALARKYRALRTAALLSFPTLTPEWEAEVSEAFFDQSHMIRELRLFVGRTPARLGDDESPYLSEMLDPRNLREIRMPDSPQ
ncbi:helix-turn-helix transcriptional regulator [Altererythrobacter sp. BO-6]|uniref:helix-turn-helix domain-containing protein n=1 Tax=Altererythrobacter sp. BO-6 TaxID=2604537 RepID=UPI0013E1CF4F|nr:helix-turn-helix domain-containing protein [Altererythrobacter sp. BO-6]QIG54179.1 helix-turn-helix transcriptional regulator [Altererythrobacter sp. BO-6]